VNKKQKKRNSKSPFVFSNFAVTADGKIAFASREFVPFGSERDHEHMMELRAMADAVMAGARTVETPGTTLGPGSRKFQQLRLARGLSEYNLRVIVSGNGSMNVKAEIFKRRFSPIIVLVSGRATERQLRELRSVADEVAVFGKTEIDFSAALHWLREKWKVKRLLCEGGGGLHGTMVRLGLIDELHLTMCSKVFGGINAPTIADGGNNIRLDEAARFKLKFSKRVGDELFVVFKSMKSHAF